MLWSRALPGSEAVGGPNVVSTGHLLWCDRRWLKVAASVRAKATTVVVRAEVVVCPFDAFRDCAGRRGLCRDQGGSGIFVRREIARPTFGL